VLDYLKRIFPTPSFWGTIAGSILAGLGFTTSGAILLVAVGIGGCGIALSIGVEAGRDPWRVDTVLEAIVESLRLRRMQCLLGLVTHLPQGVVGLILLEVGS